MEPRTSSLESTAVDPATYFDYHPASCNVSPMKPKKSNVHCLDAFHQRPDTPSFDLPQNASLYIKRALPPLPPPPTALPALQRCSSSESLCSGQSSRPGTAMTNRQSCDKALPAIPSHRRCPSVESVGSKPGDVESMRPSRPRAGRSISFRGLIDRYSSSSTSIDDVPSLTSSMSSVSTRDSRTDSVVGDYALTTVTTNGTMSATSSRRPSTLSLTQLRAASKKANAAPPPLPLRPTTGRKHSTSAGSVHRWNPFGRNSEECKEDIPPMPCTPPFVQELSFNQCYYFFARNCNGYIMSNGVNGDACENCARSGYLGSP